MSELLAQYLDGDFIAVLSDLAPMVFAGFILGAVVAVVGWVVGFVVRLGRVDV